MYSRIHSFINVFLSSIDEEISELKKNQQELKRNLSALREPSVGQDSSLLIREENSRDTSTTAEYSYHAISVSVGFHGLKHKFTPIQIFFLVFWRAGGTLVLLVALSFRLFPLLYYISETNTFL